MGLFDIFSTANERAAADNRIAGLNQGYDLASGLFSAGRDTAAGLYGSAYAPFTTLFDQSRKGMDTYGDAAGIYGADGMQRAREAFTQSPGYAEGLESGLNALDRRAASRGMLGSGNNIQDTLKFATDYANRGFGDYVSRLAPYMGLGTSSAAGMAGVQTGLGNLLNTSFQTQGGLGFQKEKGIGDANAAYELSKDTTGGNILGAIFGAANLGGKLFGMK